MSPKSNQNVDKSDMAELIAFWDDVSSSQSEETEDRLKKNDWVKSRLESLFPDMTGLNIADIGTGCGLLAISYAKLGHNVDATDVSEKMLEKAKVLANKNGVKVNFILDDAMDTKLPENHYDLVLLRDVLSNLVDAPRALLSIIDIVKPGGILLISDGRYFRYLYDREYKAREEFFELKDGNSEYASMLGLTPEQYLRLEKTVGHFDINQKDRPSYEMNFLLSLGMTDAQLHLEDKDDYVHFTEYGLEKTPLRYTLIVRKPLENRMKEQIHAYPYSYPISNGVCPPEVIASQFALIGNEFRIKILRDLENGPQIVSSIAEKIGLSINMTSYHLAKLKEAGFVERVKMGKESVYRLKNEPRMYLLFDLMSQIYKQNCNCRN